MTAAATDELPFDDLPTLAARLASQVSAADRSLAERATAQLLRPHAPLPYVLGPVTWQWAFSLVKQPQRGFFLSLRPQRRAQQGNQIVVEIEIELRFAPVATPAPAVSLPQVSFQLGAPPFLVLAPNVAQLQRYAPLTSSTGVATRDNTLLLRIGPDPDDILAAWIPDVRRKFQKAQLWYRSQSLETSSGWRLAPFVALIETLRAWLDAGPERDRVSPFAPFSDQRTDPDTILRRIVQAYCRATKALAAPSGEATNSERLTDVGRHLTSAYTVAEFRSTAALRLDDDGSLAVQSKADQPFLMRQSVQLERDERTGVTARVSVLPPDFLVAGALFEQFMELLSSEADTVADALDLRTEAFDRFLTDARQGASVVRIDRKSRQRDVNLILLRGAIDDEPRLVLLRSLFRVNTSADPPVVARARRLLKKAPYEVVYQGPPAASHAVLDDDGALYFKRLLGALKSWMEAID
ncbi:MAG: hypothetical protein AAF657_32945 [Acidobacteriota bacterium]